MKPEMLNKFIAQMKIELAEAEAKHPHFADGLSERSAGNVKFNLKAMRDINGKPPYMADRIILEEVFEAIAAYQEKDLVPALLGYNDGAIRTRMTVSAKDAMEAMGIDKARFEAEFADFIEIKKKADSLVRAY